MDSYLVRSHSRTKPGRAKHAHEGEMAKWNLLGHQIIDDAQGCNMKRSYR